MSETLALNFIYVILNLLSLALLGRLIALISQSTTYFLKNTLLQLCICAFFIHISYLPSTLYYGDVMDATMRNPLTLCIVQAKFTTFFSYPLEILPIALTINLWFAVVKYDVKIEQKYFWWFTGFIWGWTIFYNIISLIFESKETNSNVSANKFFCAQSFKLTWIWYCYSVSMFILITISLVITVHSSVVLWSRWRNFTQRQSRNTAIKLGLAGRLVVLSFIYLISLTISVLSALTKYLSKKSSGWSISADFSSCLIGVIIFLIFGTTKSAAIFLPCCYYVPPNNLISQQSRPCQNEVNPAFQLQNLRLNGNHYQLPSGSINNYQLMDDPADMNMPDSSGGGSSFLTNSSQNIATEDPPPLPRSPLQLPSPTIPLQTRDSFRMARQCLRSDLQQKVDAFIANYQPQNIHPPPQLDANINLGLLCRRNGLLFYHKGRRPLNAFNVFKLIVRQEAVRMSEDDWLVINNVAENLWKRSSPQEKLAYRTFSKNVNEILSQRVINVYFYFQGILARLNEKL
ncbi:14959_t:CDS:2 [Cetraspora pellucida]|uniref:14959_t:CDS:1 n=1 Tax=Cetraspora pellucida TaxID=1433469 RepID=A0A9N9A835_9GLOM|nr:14959_t:CDS:2 [Cetraspora pellucida]